MGIPITTQLMSGISDSVNWACRPHELFLLNQLGYDYMEKEAFADAVHLYKRLVALASGVEHSNPDLWELFNKNLQLAEAGLATTGSR